MKKLLESKEAVLLKTLLRFFRRPSNLNAVVPVLTETDSVSLRVLDWFVTNYSREFTKEIMKDPILQCFDVYNSYKSQLKAFNKKLFDPFCRVHSQLCSPVEVICTSNFDDDEIDANDSTFLLKVVNPSSLPPSPSSSPSSSSSSGKFYLQYGKSTSQKILTTIAQLNFFRWAIENRVLEYVTKYADTFKADLKMKENQKKSTRIKKSPQLLPKSKCNPTIHSSEPVRKSGYVIVFD